MQRVLLVLNPGAASAAERTVSLRERLEDLGMQVSRHVVEDPSGLPDLIRCHRDKVDAVVVGGGDGTLNAALPGILETALPLGIVPLGTANDLARTLEIPLDAGEACAVIGRGRQRRIDIGRANGRPFFNAVAFGLSAHATERITREQKQRLGPLTYPAAVMDAFRRRRVFRVEVHTDAGTRSLRSIQVVVANGLYFGGGTPVREDATIDDGRLDLFSIPPHPVSRLFSPIVAVLRGTSHRHAEVETMAADAMEITTVPDGLPASIDGELLLRTPLELRVERLAATVLVP